MYFNIWKWNVKLYATCDSQPKYVISWINILNWDLCSWFLYWEAWHFMLFDNVGVVITLPLQVCFCTIPVDFDIISLHLSQEICNLLHCQPSPLLPTLQKIHIIHWIHITQYICLWISTFIIPELPANCSPKTMWLHTIILPIALFPVYSNLDARVPLEMPLPISFTTVSRFSSRICARSTWHRRFCSKRISTQSLILNITSVKE